MKASIDYIQQRFEQFNREIFGGKLPPAKIVLSRAKTYVGQCAFNTKVVAGKVEIYDFKLKFNSCMDLAADELDDIIIHEMIHYYIYYFRLKDTSPHGKVFRMMMGQINRKYGRHISISHRTSHAQKMAVAEANRRWHVVAVVSYDDGRRGMKVLPRVEPRVVSYCNGLMDARCGVASIALYMTNHPYFNLYPCSSALSVYFPDMQEVANALADAEELVIEAGHVKRKNR